MNIQYQRLFNLLGLSGLKTQELYNKFKAWSDTEYRTSREFQTKQEKIAADRARAKEFGDALSNLYASHAKEAVDEVGLRRLYEPMLEVLRYADKVSESNGKEISVHVAYGNMGNYQNSDGIHALGMANLISSLSSHSRLHLYGSHRVDGKGQNIISEFTSEGSSHPERLPDVFGNGQNIVLTTPRNHNLITLLYKLCINPWALGESFKEFHQDMYADGTSFAAPHGAAVSAAVKSLFKENGIKLTSEAYEVLLASCADPVRFSKEYLNNVLIPEITKRLADNFNTTEDQITSTMIKAELKEEAKRRGGAGAINAQRMKAVSDEIIVWANQNGITQIDKSTIIQWLNQQITA
ncbi:MAG: S8 family serine peptidase [Candidatus Caenarcaniphilales bacterium]|nr:S8 family serine peptidase [Candidatus Caenarcaniphilales bacterium]